LAKTFIGGWTKATGQVRNVRSLTTHGTRPVELVTSDPRGDVVEGQLSVPSELCADMKDVQLKQRRNDFIASHIRKWVEARERGAMWPHYPQKLTGKPVISGPFKAPKDVPEAEDPDFFIYRVRAYFKPTETVLAGFSDISEIERKAQLFGVNLWEQSPESPMNTRVRKVIRETGQFEDPIKVAEERRNALGVKREDYFVPEWHKE
jgi:hypothetical protein